jgi:hypothetical protein
MAEQPTDHGRKHSINLTPSQVAASALAASCSAIVASYLGVAGTVIGAAVGSVVATTGAAIYGHLLRSSGTKIKTTLGTATQEHAAGRGLPGDPNATRYGTSPAFKPQTPTPHGSTPASFSPQSPRLYGATQQSFRPQSPTPPTFKPQSFEPQSFEAEPFEKRTVAPQPDSASATAARPWTAYAPPEADSRRPSAYRRPLMLAGAALAVFAVAISIGFLLGGPVRQAGNSYFAPPPNTATPGAPAPSADHDGSTPTAPATASTPSTSVTGDPTPSTPGDSPTASSPATPSGSATLAPTEPGSSGGAGNPPEAPDGTRP